MEEKQVKRTERGWVGHFICGDRCAFRRNTLLECAEVRVVISSVGMMRDVSELRRRKYLEVGCGRHFETMAFHAKHDGRYWDADVSRQIPFDSEWAIAELDSDDKASDMHEAVVAELAAKLAPGETFQVNEYSQIKSRISLLFFLLASFLAAAQVPATDGVFYVGGQPRADDGYAPRSVKVYIYYPGGSRANVQPSTGLVVITHNCGGSWCDGAANPSTMANAFNVAAICMDYLQSGDAAFGPHAYEFSSTALVICRFVS